MTAEFVPFVYDEVSVRGIIKEIKFYEHILHYTTHKLFINKMFQKVQKYLNRWRSYVEN